MSTIPSAPVKTSQLARASLALGLLTVVLAFMGVGSAAIPILLAMLFSGISAIVLGLLGRSAIHRSADQLDGLGLTVWGIVLAVVGVPLGGVGTSLA